MSNEVVGTISLHRIHGPEDELDYVDIAND
jgi:hypothetical protein